MIAATKTTLVLKMMRQMKEQRREVHRRTEERLVE